jgi:hypothetical protein
LTPTCARTATESCADEREHKFNRVNMILHARAAQLRKRGIMSPKTQLGDKTLAT